MSKVFDTVSSCIRRRREWHGHVVRCGCAGSSIRAAIEGARHIQSARAGGPDNRFYLQRAAQGQGRHVPPSTECAWDCYHTEKRIVGRADGPEESEPGSPRRDWPRCAAATDRTHEVANSRVVCLPNFHTKSALRCSACFSPSAHPNPILAHPIPSAHTPTRPPLPSHLIALPARVSTHCVGHNRCYSLTK